MAQTIITKNGTLSTGPTSLTKGELALNTDSGSLYYGDTAGAVSNDFTFGEVTASQFVGGGAGITGVTAEWDGTHTGTADFTGDITASGHISASGNVQSNYVIAKIPMIQLRTTDTTTDINDGSNTNIEWDVQDIYDSDYFTHDTGTNPHYIEVTQDGRYEIYFNLVYTTSAVRTQPHIKPKKVSSGVHTYLPCTANSGYARWASSANSSTSAASTVAELLAGDKVFLTSKYKASWGATGTVNMAADEGGVGMNPSTIIIKKIG